MQPTPTVAIPTHENVDELSDADVEDFARENEYAIVEVYTQWCSVCRAFAPHYAALADEFEGEIAFGRIDADPNAAYAERHGVQAFPTLLIYRNGELESTVVGFKTPPELRAHLRDLTAAE